MNHEEPIVGTTLTASADNTAAVVADIVSSHLEPRLIDLGDDTKLIAHAPGIKLTEVTPLTDKNRTAPKTRTGTAKFTDLASFIAHVDRFKDADSALWADRSRPSLTSVLDYHRSGAEGSPRFGTHRGVYQFPLSKEWQAWRAKNGQKFTQAEFAEFLEERILDVADPASAGAVALDIASTLEMVYASPSKLIELSRGLSLRVDQRVTNAKNLATGESHFQFTTTHTTDEGAPLRVPSGFLIAIPVFDGGANYQLPVRLRYRLTNGVLAWFYELSRSERAFDDAFSEACTAAQAATTLPLFMGSPE